MSHCKGRSRVILGSSWQHSNMIFGGTNKNAAANLGPVYGLLDYHIAFRPSPRTSPGWKWKTKIVTKCDKFTSPEL